MKVWIGAVAVGLLGFPSVAGAGHHAPAYIDGGQSADGRFVVTVEAKGPQPDGPFTWTATWRDLRQNQVNRFELAGASTGGLASHIFVAADGETFAVWEPLTYSTSKGKVRRLEAGATKENDEWRGREEFTHRLCVHKKTGELVKALGVNDIARPDEWPAFSAVFERLEWLMEYDGLAPKKAPRAGYALYRVSPDYTVLEVRVRTPKTVNGGKGRTVRISLTDGKLLDEKSWPRDEQKVPVRPFQGPGDVSNLSVEARDHYKPSLDPVRSEGRFP